MTILDCAHLLCCPDDRSPLVPGGESLQCSRCQRQFLVIEGRIADLRPADPARLSSAEIVADYEAGRAQLASADLQWDGQARGWGANHPQQRGTGLFFERHLARISRLLPRQIEVFADVSAAAGNYSFPLARRARIAFHCDLDPGAITGGWRRAQQERMGQMFFVRSDYFSLPFAENSLDAVICTDTLCRGPAHELSLLKSIARVLAPNGMAVVDLKTKRLIARPDDQCWYYRRGEVEALLREAGFGDWRIENFGCIPTRFLFAPPVFRMNAPLAHFLGPTRFLATLRKTRQGT